MKLSTSSMMALLAVGAGTHALADVTLLSRASRTTVRYIDHMDPGPDESWTDSAEFTEPGPWDVTLPHGWRHQDHANAETFGGRFTGSYFGGSNIGWYSAQYTDERMTVEFRIEGPREIALTFDAMCYPCLPGVNRDNAGLTLRNLGTGELVFDLYRDGAGAQSGFASVNWASQMWSVVLAAGDYEVVGFADAVNKITSAGHNIGDGRMNFTATIGELVCPVDFNGDSFLDFADYSEFVACFEGAGCPDGRDADFNGDGFADFFDYGAYVDAFEAGC